MDAKEIADEEARLRQLRALVDRAQEEIRAGRVSDEQVAVVIARLRAHAEHLFPGTGNTFDLIYRPRLERAAREHREGMSLAA